MRKRLTILFLSVILFSPFVSQVSGAEEIQSEISGEYAPDRVIVTYAEDSTPDENAKVKEKTKKDVEATSSKPISPKQSKTQVIRIGSNVSVVDAIKRLRNQPGVVAVQPDFKVYALDVPPTDSYYASNQLWGMYGPNTFPTSNFGSNATAAWGRGFTGSSSVAVGVVDEGIQLTHPELAQNIWVNPNEIAGNNKDDDGNGYIDDVNGWDFYNNDNSVFDGSSRNTGIDDHGTHVSGTIGARANNGTGVAGVNWNVKIISAKFLGPNGGYTSDAVAALDYLTNLKKAGVPVVASNNSWGGGGYDQALLDAINRGGDQGILFVAAAGNNASNNNITSNYPSNYSCTGTSNNRGWDCVIAVAAINSTGALSSFSNYGSTTVDLGAPGEGIWSSVPINSFASSSGTSMATPHVTGAVALCASMGLQSAQSIKSAILNSVTPTASLTGKTSTGGRLNLDAMTTLCSGKNPQNELVITNTTLNTAPGKQITLTSSGGSGTGATSYVTTSTGCTISNSNLLTSTLTTNCLVYAVKDASSGLTMATSAAKSFAFAFLTQPAIQITNTPLIYSGATTVLLTTTGGAGDGMVTFAVRGTGCVISNTNALTVNIAPTSCAVTATKAASGDYAVANSPTTTFTFNGVAQAPLTITSSTNSLSNPKSTNLNVLFSGGTGSGAVRYSVSGKNCSINSSTGLLTTSNRVASCTVTVNKAASGIYLAATVSAIFNFF